MSLTEQWAKASRSFSNSNCLEARWAKASRSFSNSNCLEAAFRKSSHCQNGECAEAAVRDGTVLVRDSKLGEGSPVLEFAPGAWGAFLATIK